MKKRTLGWILLFLFFIHPFFYINSDIYLKVLTISAILIGIGALIAYLIGWED